MAEILFYHLQRQPLEAVLPTLLLRSLERGWRAVVQAASPERVCDLDDHLWIFSEESFLPHATDAEADLSAEPVVLTTGAGNPNGAQVRFLVDGAGLPDDAASYQRLVLLFDGNDEDALAAARRIWSQAKAAGHEATYWQQSEAGRWEKKA
jgi:DNA polymerase-3 subunit chi